MVLWTARRTSNKRRKHATSGWIVCTEYSTPYVHKLQDKHWLTNNMADGLVAMDRIERETHVMAISPIATNRQKTTQSTSVDAVGTGLVS